eukprot:TRINITY_DN24782_c0_g1_i1.p1 TRINITY_DN24782_c0_g1~~TRINITY_DN24782_c0_g1_i1.p1  ORF type:complete len:146 (-),score=18.13 TRINITY_DN24782_c0_g1_i1:6-443(-)
MEVWIGLRGLIEHRYAMPVVARIASEGVVNGGRATIINIGNEVGGAVIDTTTMGRALSIGLPAHLPYGRRLGVWSTTIGSIIGEISTCLLYTSDAADDLLCVDLGGRRIIKKKKKKKHYMHSIKEENRHIHIISISRMRCRIKLS